MNTFFNLVGVLLIAFGLFTGGFFTGKLWGGSTTLSGASLFEIVGDTKNADVTQLDFDQFWRIWQALESSYVEPDVSEEDLYYGAIKGLVSGVDDPATVFLTPEETEQYIEGNQGEFEGIGAELGYEGGSLVVIAPIEGSPALAAGLRAGDRILKVDNVDVTGENLFQVVTRIRGNAGTKVVVTVVPKGKDKSVDVEVTRGTIIVPSVSYEGISHGIAIIDIDRFTESSVTTWQSRWDDVVADVASDDPDAIIVDLRGDPGGYFNAAIWAAGEFLPQGTLVSQQEDRNGAKVDFTVERTGRFLDVPIVVLVDSGSASASEILAGALKHYDRAYIIGEATYGKGTAQQIVDYADGSSLHITTLKWLLPDGSWLNPENVITPDKEVAYSEEAFKKGEDPQLDAAQTYLSSQF